MFIYNCVFIAEHLNQNHTSSFRNYFTYMANQHHHNTQGTVRKLVNVPQYNTSFYGTRSITAKSVRDWNNLQKKFLSNLIEKMLLHQS